MVVCLVDRLPLAGRQGALDLPGAARWRCSPCCSSASCAADRGAGSIWASSTCSRRSSPRPAWRWSSPSCSARAAAPSRRRRTCSWPRRSPPVPLVLIARQPDLGTAVTLLPVLGAIVFAAGLPMRYPRHRRAGRRGAGADRLDVRARGLPEGAHRHVPRPGAGRRAAPATSRSRRASPSARAGVTGKGFMKGTQGQLRFLPVAHNDFIFSVLAEEQGFAGVVVALALYLFVIMRSLDAARLSKDRVGAYPRAGRARQLHVPGRLQHHHVGRSGAGQGAHAAAHELRRVVDDRHARRLRPHPRTCRMRRFTN